MKVILVRHGETEENASGIIQGHLPGRLSARGREQIEMLGQRLATHRIDAAYSSDLARARETAEAIARHHPGLQVTWTRDLRERFLGRYQGMKGSDIDRAELATAPEVETHEQMLQRARRLLDRLRRAHPDGTVLLSGHGGINYAIVAAATGRSLEETRASIRMDNAGICLLEGEGDLAVAVANDTTHLASEAVS
jgi:broad specificity phosphatase PhoE